MEISKGGGEKDQQWGFGGGVSGEKKGPAKIPETPALARAIFRVWGGGSSEKVKL